MAQKTGKVKWFNDQKGFGFITPDEAGEDIFVHISVVERAGLKTLSEGQKVAFDTEINPKNRKHQAANLVIVKEAA